MGRIQAQPLATDGAGDRTTEPPPAGNPHRVAETFNAALLAIMGRRRLVVMTGPSGARSEALVRLARHLDVDGALVLAAGGRADVQVEHLIRAAAHDALPASQRPVKFEALIDHLANLLEAMGTGVLIVDHAERLSAAALSDLVELSGTQSDTGRFLQIVLAGSEPLMRRMAEDARDLFGGIAVAVPLAPPETPAAAPAETVAAVPEPARTVEPPRPAAEPPRLTAELPRTAEPPPKPAAVPETAAKALPLTAPAPLARPRLQAPLPRMRPLAGKPLPQPGAAARRRNLWVAAAGLAAVALLGSLAAAPRWIGDTASGAGQSVAAFVDRFRSLGPADAAFTEVARPAPAEPTAAAANPSQPTLPAPAAAPPKAKMPATQVASAPPAPKPPPAAERPSLPVEALSMREPPPLETGTATAKPDAPPAPTPAPAREVATAPAPQPSRTASIDTPARREPPPRETPVLRDTPAPSDAPTLRDTPLAREVPIVRDAARTVSPSPSAPAPQDVAVARADALRTAPPLAQSGSTALPAAPPILRERETSAGVEALVAQARRQIDDRHLTTPIGDNALETVRAMEDAAAAGIEPARLRAAIVDSYLRLGALAEQRGQYPLARVYYRRAQQAIPDHEKIGARLGAVEARIEEIREEARQEAHERETVEAPHPSLPSDAPKLR